MGKYLKMADVFDLPILGSRAEFFPLCLNESSAMIAAHAINSHDELVAEVERLTKSAELAIMTLEEVDRVLTERIKNGACDLDDISGEVTYALDKISSRE